MCACADLAHYRMLCAGSFARGALAVPRSLDLPHDARRIADDDAAWWDVARDYTRRGNDAAVTNCDSGQHDRMRPDETVAANEYIAIRVAEVVMCQDRGAERYRGVATYVNTARIGFVESRTKRNARSFTQVHLPDPNKVLASNTEYEIAHGVSDDRREGNRHNDGNYISTARYMGDYIAVAV